MVTAPYVERFFWGAGLARVAGVDEVGMGPLAGPVVAAAVVFRPDTSPLPGIADSKRLSEAARERAAAAIRATAWGVGLGVVEAPDVDRLNVYQAGLEAMRQAVAALPEAPDHVLVDGRTVSGLAMPETCYVGGDTFVYSIAAASIVAKVHRDALMREADAQYPGYGFGRHVGYGTPEHLEALATLGLTPLHRRSFAPCATRV